MVRRAAIRNRTDLQIYAETFSDEKRLELIEAEAQRVANQAFTTGLPVGSAPQPQETQ
jgi:hypothetical protein